MEVGPAAPAALDPRRWLALFACLTTLGMALLDATVVVIALPSISQSTGAHPAQLQWVISGYALSFGVVPILAGRLGDDRGRKEMLLIGTAGFILTSAVIGFAPNPNVLIFARVAQGLAGGLLNPQISGFVQNMFPRHERARAFSIIGAMIGVTSAAGPVVGGLIIYVFGTHIGWRITFLINVPVGLVAFVLSARLLPKLPRRYPVRRLDLPGVALMTLALLALLFPAVEFDSDRDPRLALLWIPAAALLAAFWWWEAGPATRQGHPLIDLSLFRIQTYADANRLALFYFACIGAMPLILTLFLQEGLGYSAVEAAGVGAAAAVTISISSIIAGRLLPRFGATVLVVALIVLTVGFASMTLVGWLAVGSISGGGVGWLLLPPLAVTGLGMGAVTSNNQVLAFADVDAQQGSTAGGMLQTTQRASIAIGTAIASAVYYSVALSGHSASGRAHVIRYGHAFTASLSYLTALAVISLFVAIRSMRHVRADRLS